MYLSALSLALNRPGAVSLEQVVASLFASGEQGAWYDPSAANVTWRRNLLTYTEQFDLAQYVKTEMTVSANTTVAPDGTSTADTFTPSGVNAGHRVYIALSNFNAQVVSCHFKANGYNKVSLKDWLTGVHAAFDLSSTSVINKSANVTASIVDAGNGWKRCVMITTQTETAGVQINILAPAYTSGDPNGSAFSGDGSSVFVWGLQYERGLSATPYQRIVTPEITYLADVQSQPLLFQDYGGTVPVVSVESPVGLILDKRNGLALGSELVDTMNTAAAWTPQGNNTVTDSNGEVTVTYVDTLLGAYAFFRATAGLSSNLTIGKWYKLTGEAKVNTGTVNITVVAAETANVADITSTTFVPFSVYFAAGSATGNYLRVGSMGAGEAITLRNLSLKLLDGNHAYQTGSTARPVLRARYNLLTYSEQFDNAAWTKALVNVTANAVVAPDGTTTADTLTEVLNSNGAHEIYTRPNRSGGHCISIYAKAGTKNWCSLSYFTTTQNATFFDLSGTGAIGNNATGNTPTITSVGNGWFRLTVSRTEALDYFVFRIASANGTNEYLASGTDTIHVWGADCRVGTSAGDYQRIAAATDYATTSTITGQPFRPYLDFGDASASDDGLFTSSIDFSATDEMTVHLGLMKYTDATYHFTFELSASASANNGAFVFFVPLNDTNKNYGMLCRGTSNATASSPASGAGELPAPDSRVISAQMDISTDTLIMRGNGTQIASSTQDQGTGNFGNYPLFIGFRSGVSANRFRGRMYAIIVRGKLSSAGELAAAESYVGSKMGITL